MLNIFVYLIYLRNISKEHILVTASHINILQLRRTDQYKGCFCDVGTWRAYNSIWQIIYQCISTGTNQNLFTNIYVDAFPLPHRSISCMIDQDHFVIRTLCTERIKWTIFLSYKLICKKLVVFTGIRGWVNMRRFDSVDTNVNITGNR